MNELVSKILVGVSLAVTIALAVPLGLMAMGVVRGESPRQLAKEELTEDGGTQAADDSVDSSGESEPYIRPVVQPDPGPVPAAEPDAGAELETPAETTEKPASTKSSSPVKQRTQTAAAEPAPVQPKNTLPKAVLGPGEAPCMVDGLDGYSYDYDT